MPYDLGDTVPLTANCTDADGTLSDAVTVTLTITLPDGTESTPSVTNPPASTGVYTYDYPTVQAGLHRIRWLFATPAAAYTDVIDVREPSPPLIMSLADAKAHLVITTATKDDELRGWIETTTRVVEHFAGACARRTVVEDHDITDPYGIPAVALRRTPALTLTTAVAVLSGGTDYDVVDLDLDGATGIVRRLDGGRLVGPLRVTYTAGRAVIPANIRDAAKIILQHLWRTQYGASRGLPAIGGGEDFSVTEPVPGYGYAIPNRALNLLEPDRLPPGVA